MSSLTPDLPLTAAQAAAFEQFARLRVGALFLEQGMGKTRLALELINHRAGKIDDVLWVAPCSVLQTIRAEIGKWGTHVPVRLVGYETLSLSGATWLETLDWVRGRRLLIVADESIFIKNRKSKRSTRMYELRSHADYALILNGTPLTRDLWDLKRQMDFLSPKILDTDDRAYRIRYFDEHRTVTEFGEERVWYRSSEVNVAHLTSLIRPYIYEAKLDVGVEVFRRAKTHPVSQDTEITYERARDEFLLEWERTQGSEIVLYKLFTNLTRIAATCPRKCAAVAESVRGEHCLVFCNYLAEQQLIAKHLGGECLMVNGETGPDEREAVFTQSRIREVPLVLTYGVGSYGLNLQHIHLVHFASPTFDYGRTTQAGSRVRRLGQGQDITYTDHVTALGIDTLIARNAGRKEWLADLMHRAIDPRGVL